MSRIEDEQPEELLADALAAYDDRLAAGISVAHKDLETTVDPTLRPEWNRLMAFLSLVERAWPRGNQGLDDTTISAVNLTSESPCEDTESDDFPAATIALPHEQGQRFGRFEIKKTLGQGGFGIVYLAWDPALRRQVALKVPQPESVLTPEARKRFRREAHAAAGLDHPNIVPVYESGTVGTVSYIVSAYVAGPTLALWLARQTCAVPARCAARLVATLARAAAHAHERGVLHCDLKPSNILLQPPHRRNDPDQVDHGRLGDFVPRIADFSLAKLTDGPGPDTKSGIPFGSPPYMAPEQAEGRLEAIGPATDVYALGCILHELVTAHPPFEGASQLEVLRRVIAHQPVPLRQWRRDLASDLEAVVLKCLEKEPDRRYGSAVDLADDLDRFLASEPTRARPPGPWNMLRRKATRHPSTFGIVVIVSACLLILILVGAWYEARLHHARQQITQKQASDQAKESSRDPRLR